MEVDDLDHKVNVFWIIKKSNKAVLDNNTWIGISLPKYFGWF